jgi:hypothetical protein
MSELGHVRMFCPIGAMSLMGTVTTFQAASAEKVKRRSDSRTGRMSGRNSSVAFTNPGATLTPRPLHS